MTQYATPYLSSDRFDELLSPAIQPPRLALKAHQGELWIVENTTGQLVNVGNRHLLALGIYTVQVRGASYYAPMVKAADLTLGSAVELMREPNNVNDPNAIAVSKGDLVLGYWNKQMARPLAKVLDAGTKLDAIILAGTPSGRSAERVRVLAAEPELLAHLRGTKTRVPHEEAASELGRAEPRSLISRLFGRRTVATPRIKGSAP